MVIRFQKNADVAQSVERSPSKQEVVGSRPIVRSKLKRSSVVERGAVNAVVEGSNPSASANSGSSKGKTSDFDSDNGGSNPSPETKFDRKKYQMLFMRDKRKADKLGLKVSEYRKMKGNEL